jgi:hypothetical protein
VHETPPPIAVGLFCLVLLGCGIFLGEGLWRGLPRALPILINGFALCCLALTPAIAGGDCKGTCDYNGATPVLAMIGLGLGLATARPSAAPRASRDNMAVLR